MKFNAINLLTVLILAIMAFRFFKYRHTIILILIAGPLIQSSVFIITNLPQTAQSRARLKPGPISTTQKNVFIMSYDALQSRSVKQAIDALPQKDRAEFDGFTFYEDVLSHGHNTRASNLLTKIGHSIPPGVTNISQAKNILPKIHHSAESPMEENQHHAMITDKLIAAGYNIETFGHFSNSETQSHYIKSTFETKTDYKQALKASQMKNLTNFLKKRKKKKLPSVFPRLSSMDDYNFNLNNLNPGSIQPVFKLQPHFSHIH